MRVARSCRDAGAARIKGLPKGADGACTVARPIWLSLLIVILFSAPALTRGRRDSGECVRIERVTAFAPRGEVYVEVGANCDEADFQDEDPVLVYLEVLVGSRHPVGEDVRFYSDDDVPGGTFVFRDLDFERGDPLLARIVRFGKILSLQSIRVP